MNNLNEEEISKMIQSIGVGSQSTPKSIGHNSLGNIFSSNN